MFHQVHFPFQIMILKNHIPLTLDRLSDLLYYVTPDSMSNAVDLLLKAAGYIDLIIRDVIIRLPPDIKYV